MKQLDHTEQLLRIVELEGLLVECCELISNAAMKNNDNPELLIKSCNLLDRAGHGLK